MRLGLPASFTTTAGHVRLQASQKLRPTRRRTSIPVRSLGIIYIHPPRKPVSMQTDHQG